jgi:hypothetical protein
LSGYSKTPLIKKLGIKEDFRIGIFNAPLNYFELLGDLPKGIDKAKDQLNFIHLFSNSVEEIEKQLPILMKKIVVNGMIWVSWYKKGSGKQKMVNEDLIRDTAIGIGMVDIKVCAVDKEWSALKLVIRKENR